MSITKSQRKAYGEELVALGAENPRVVALEADLGKSTMSNMFQEAYPERYFEMGIAEANMLSTAAGLAAGGKIPFCSTFAVFAAGRPYDQIRQTICIGNLNVKICGSSSGLSDFGDGSTHQAIEDVAIMSAIPNMTVLTPCDATETRQAVRYAAQIEGPVYIRVVRNDTPDVINEDATAAYQPLRVIKDGTDVVIFAHGVMVERALDAAKLLALENISAKVVNIAAMKPFSYEKVAEIAAGAKAVVTAEDHTYIGGLASAVALSLKQSAVPMDCVSIQDVFGQSAYGIDELMNYYGLTAEAIAEKAKALIL